MRAGQPRKRDISRISEDDPGEREGKGMVHSGGGGGTTVVVVVQEEGMVMVGYHGCIECIGGDAGMFHERM
ncbi:hypothetical protein E2C01_077498 [Portunus trituberculatus]|uniref:Uncharacterized protein n=1 Tax=Portunus trituberculatus TaxID=210409 RepID=A0A5B7IKD6_PORTR|nr:hypothetical protein [Portunus trituberculatus]